MRTPVAAVISAFLLFPLSADEEVSEDSLFSGDDMVEEVEITDGEEPPENELLVSETVKWGGGFESELDAEWTWRDGGETGLPPDSSSLDIALGADVFLDARPDEDFRVFGKLEASYPFAFDGGGSEADIRVVELFSDFHLGNRLFFRVGKHAVHWGSGYFFSPADVFNLIPIDPEKPELDREGPVNIKMHVPVGIHNIYLYVLPEGANQPSEVGISPMTELVVGAAEIGLGLYYRKENPLRGLTTFSVPVWDADIFGEAAISRGSEKTWIRKDAGGGLETYVREDEWFLQATLGILYLNPDRDIMFAGQYFYNGEGYDDPDFLKENSIDAAQLLARRKIDLDDLVMSGRHYAGVRGSWDPSNVEIALLWIANLWDGSGIVTPSFSWEIVPEHLILTLRFPVNYGEERDELSYYGRSFSVGFRAALGGGVF